MSVEIERKFLVNPEAWSQVIKPQGTLLRQGYILDAPAKTIRVRATATSAFITIKGLSSGFSRPEFEYPVPVTDALEMLELFAVSELSKVRYEISYAGKTWEVDEFKGENEGLIVAEIELEREDEVFDVPAWVTMEVTGDQRYYNSSLAVSPYRNWR